MVKEALRALEAKMKVSAEHFRRDLSKLRTGRANLSLFEDIKIEYYGTLTPVNQVASLGIPDPTLITTVKDTTFRDAATSQRRYPRTEKKLEFARNRSNRMD